MLEKHCSADGNKVIQIRSVFPDLSHMPEVQRPDLKPLQIDGESWTSKHEKRDV